jgi:organic radical activating enzyme
MMKNEGLLVKEIFKSFQGEGRNCGKLGVFIRLSGCNAKKYNLECLEWCDTKYSWEGGEWYSIDRLLAELETYDVRRVIVTGGEPLLQQHGLAKLFKELDCYDCDVEIETNGTIKCFDKVIMNNCLDVITVSPKKNIRNKKFVVDRYWLKYSYIKPELVWKFVVNSLNDIMEVKEFVEKYDLFNVYLMPNVVDKKEHDSKLKELAEMALEYGFNISPRLQIALWGNVRGR